MADDQDIFGQYPPASWTADGGQTWAFAVVDISDESGNRLVKRERPYRDGVKIDDTGSKGREWTVTSVFDNSLDEPGLAANGVPLYPAVLNALIDSMRTHECGDLVLPTVGRVRARIESIQRKEDSEHRDYAMATLKFCEDNEDAVDAAALKPPSVSASARRLMETTSFDAEESGAWDGSLSDLNEFVSELEGIANAPDAMLGEIADRARIVRHNVDRLESTFSQAGKEGRDLLLDPANSRLMQKLTRLSDLAGSAEGEATRRQRPTATRSFGQDMSLAAIAAQLGQGYDELLALNAGRVEDPGLVEAGTVVRVFV